MQHPIIETWCYEQMAMLSSAMAFSYSKWNSDTQDREKVLFQGCETLQDEPLPEVFVERWLCHFFYLFILFIYFFMFYLFILFYFFFFFFFFIFFARFVL